MADINVLDLTPTTPGSNDSLILFDRTTGEGKSTRFDTLSSQVLDSKFGDSNPTAGQELSYDATTGKYKNTSRINSLNEALTKQTLYFTSVACAATTGNFATVSNANISADHVVVECTFANPAAIITDVSWTTANGSLTLNGTCASATTANITLSKKGN